MTSARISGATAPPLLDSEAAYDVLAPAYDLLTAGYAYAPWLEAIARLARSCGLAGRRALDVACGTGMSLEALLELGFEAVGCDASPGMAAVARRKLSGRAEVHVADMRSLPVYGRFDLVTCLDDALNHLPSAADVERALRAMGANLAPDGLLAFDVNTLTAYRSTDDRIAGLEVLAVRGQRPGGRLEPTADEERHHKALFLVRRARRERRTHALAAVDH